MSSESKVIVIIVSPSGQVSVQTRGFTGSSCRQASRVLEQALGIVQSDQPTAEMYQSTTNQQQARQSGG